MTCLRCPALLLLVLLAAPVQGEPVQTDPKLAAAKAATDAGDLPRAVQLYEQAVAGGKAMAESELARIYLEGGETLAPDYAAARGWAETAAADGDSRGLRCPGPTGK